MDIFNACGFEKTCDTDHIIDIHSTQSKCASKRHPGPSSMDRSIAYFRRSGRRASVASTRERHLHC